MVLQIRPLSRPTAEGHHFCDFVIKTCKLSLLTQKQYHTRQGIKESLRKSSQHQSLYIFFFNLIANSKSLDLNYLHANVCNYLIPSSFLMMQLAFLTFQKFNYCIIRVLRKNKFKK